MKLGMEDISDVLELEALCGTSLGHPNPCNVSLANVHKTLGIVYKMVNLPFQDRLKVILHFSSCKLGHDSQGKPRPFLNIIHIRAEQLDLAVFNLVHILGRSPFHG